MINKPCEINFRIHSRKKILVREALSLHAKLAETPCLLGKQPGAQRPLKLHNPKHYGPIAVSEVKSSERNKCYVVPLVHLEHVPDWVCELFCNTLYMIEENGGGICYEGHLPAHAINRLARFRAPQRTVAPHLARFPYRAPRSEALPCYVVPQACLEGVCLKYVDVFMNSVYLVEEFAHAACYEGHIAMQTIGNLKYFRVSS